MRPLLRTLAVAAALATLAHCAPPAALPSPAATARARDPVRAAMARIRASALREDIHALVGVRHAVYAPERLADAARYIESVLRASGFRVTRQPVSHNGATADNLIAERDGTDPSRVVMAGAHYDTVAHSPGADDNASGIAATLAIARALGPAQTRATIRLCAFAFEEDGLVGSRHYVRSLAPRERARIAAMFDFDMVGYTSTRAGSQRYPAELALVAQGRPMRDRGDFIGVLGLAEFPAPVRALFAAQPYEPMLRVEYVTVPAIVRRLANDLDRGDHASFWDRDIPAVIVGDSGDYRNPNYHASTDTPATLDVPFATRVARWAAAAVMLLAEPAS